MIQVPPIKKVEKEKDKKSKDKEKHSASSSRRARSPPGPRGPSPPRARSRSPLRLEVAPPKREPNELVVEAMARLPMEGDSFRQARPVPQNLQLVMNQEKEMADSKQTLRWRLSCARCQGWVWLAHSHGVLVHNQLHLKKCQTCNMNNEEGELTWMLTSTPPPCKSKKGQKGQGKKDKGKVMMAGKGKAKEGKTALALSPGQSPWGRVQSPPRSPTAPQQPEAPRPALGPGDLFFNNVAAMGWQLVRSRSQGKLFWAGRDDKSQYEAPAEVLEMMKETMAAMSSAQGSTSSSSSSRPSTLHVLTREVRTSQGTQREVAARYQRH